MTSLNFDAIYASIIQPYAYFVDSLIDIEKPGTVEMEKVLDYSNLKAKAVDALKKFLFEGNVISIDDNTAQYIRRAFSMRIKSLEEFSEQRFFITKSQNSIAEYQYQICQLRSQMMELDASLKIIR